MPSEMEPSSSFFSVEMFSPNERQVGFWKPETIPDHNGANMDGVVRRAFGNSVASSPLEDRILMETKLVNSYELPDPYLARHQKINLSFEKHAVGAERAASHALRRPVDQDLGTKFNLNGAGDGIHVMGAQYENGFFSSSLSKLFSRKLTLTSNNALYGHSVGAAATLHDEEEPFESLEEIEAQTIGDLLPNDDDLFSGVTDGHDFVAQPTTGEDIEDLDLFSSVGGLDLGEDGFPQGQRDSEFSAGNPDQPASSVTGEHPHGEHPSRTLFVRNINSSVEDSELRALFEQYGDIRTLYTACKHRGFVMVSYYDIRASRNAMRALQNKPLRRRKLDIHFSIPKDNPSEKDVNQGTLVVFNLDSTVSNEELRQIFGVYGELKEIRETPHRSHHKFIEFYDVRAAEAALQALNRSDIAGKRIKLEPSRPGGAKRLVPPVSSEIERQDESGPYLQQQSSPINSTKEFSGADSHGGITSFGMDGRTIAGALAAIQAVVSPFGENVSHNGISSSVPNSLPSLLRVESLGNNCGLPESGHLQGQMKTGYQSNFHPHSLPEHHDGLTNGTPCNSPSLPANISSRTSERIESHQVGRLGSNGHPLELNDAVFGSSGNGNFPSPGQHYMWSNSHRHQPQGMMWPNSPTYVNGVSAAQPPPQLNALPRAPPHMLNTLLPVNNHHVGSAPSINSSLWDRRRAYAGESPDVSSFHPGSLGNMRSSTSSPHHLEYLTQNIFSHVGGNCMDLSIPPKNVGLHSPHHGSLMFPGNGPMIPMLSPFQSPNERSRSCRNDGSSNQADNKKQFELEIDRIIRGEDSRTTLMIKNIPNKYTSKMLLAAIDERHRGTYDFIYLPIDFKNKCNVGYAFINMTDPSLIIPFYQAFNGKKWEKFNSEKVASLAYARIQGKAALIAHFQNSSLMNEDKRCRPILFNTDGPNAGDQVPFPMGVNVRSRPSKARAASTEENLQESTPNLPNVEKISNGDSSSVSSKNSD